MTSQSQEPPTSAKLILNTTHGQLEIELWATECPLTCKNFISLCLEGYYDNTSFHRLIPGFMIQGGDPTGTGQGGTSIYNQEPFKDEIHTRLRFTHRGLLAMANHKPNENLSQFFFTFDACSWLDRKNTIFGKIVGNTIYNLMAMEKLDTDSEDRPVIPPKILSAQIIQHPFEDIVVRQVKSDSATQKSQQKIEQKAPKKLKKQTQLLSFQDDSEQESVDQQINNAHDVLSDKKLSKEQQIQQNYIEERRRKLEENKMKEEKLRKQIKMEAKGEGFKEDEGLDANAQKFQKEQIQGMKTRRNKKTGQVEIYWDKSEGEEDAQHQNQEQFSSTDSEDYGDEQTKNIRKKQKEVFQFIQEYENLKIEFLQFKKEKMGTAEAQELRQMKEEKKLLSNLELRRLKYVQNKRVKLKESEVLSKLNAFKKKLHSDQVQEDEDHWMNNSLKFHIDSGRAFSHFQNQDKLSEQARRNNQLNEQLNDQLLQQSTFYNIVSRQEKEEEKVQFKELDREEIEQLVQNE